MNSVNPQNPTRPSKRLRPKLRCRRSTVHKPNGVVTERVQKVGPERFGIVCCDPAKHRSEWFLADYFGNILISPQTVEHDRGHLDAAVAQVRAAVKQFDVGDLIVSVERTGQHHLHFKSAFAAAGFETRIVHPFAVRQARLPVAPGNKNDHEDLFAQQRVVVSGLGLVEPELDPLYSSLRILVRHRRDLVRENSARCCQIKEALQLCMPGYAPLFANLWAHGAALLIARATGSPQAVLNKGKLGLAKELCEHKVVVQKQTLDKILAWAADAPAPTREAAFYQRVWTDLDKHRQYQEATIFSLERDIARQFVQTPYVLLMSIPGINVISAAELAGEMGPMEHYANANAITGRAGLFPSRYQSDQTDLADGPLVRQCNRRIRGALMQMADNVSRLNDFFRGRAELLRQKKTDERAIKVKAAKRLSRLIYACVAGRQILKHECCATPDAVLEKLQAFHLNHSTDSRQLLDDLEAALQQLPQTAYPHEEQSLAACLARQSRRRKGPTHLGEILPAILARLCPPQTSPNQTLSQSNEDTALN